MNKTQLTCAVCLFSILVAPPANFASAEASPTGKKLYEAVLYQDLPQIQDLISKGADVNYRENGRPILGWASQNGNVAVVEALLKAGANPNAADEGISGHTPLMRAIDTQQVETVRALLKAKADPNALSGDGKSCLLFAVESHKPEIVQALLDANVDVKRASKDGDSPALAAAQDGSKESLEVLRLLAKAGANLNESNIVYTPLIYAIEQGNKELAQTLLDAGADPNAKTQSGRLPMQAAFDYPEILEMLIKSKADPNAVTDSGTTLLTEAIQNSNVEATKLLLQAAADPQKTDSSGRTPLEIAESNYQTEIVELLKKQLGENVAPPQAGSAGGSGSWAMDAIPVDKGSPGCTIVDAAKMQMELHGLLQAQVDAGKMSSDIFRTFNEDTKDYGRMLTENPAEACELFARLRKKYGV